MDYDRDVFFVKFWLFFFLFSNSSTSSYNLQLLSNGNLNTDLDGFFLQFSYLISEVEFWVETIFNLQVYSII